MKAAIGTASIYKIPNILVYYIMTICKYNMFIAGNWIFFWLKFMPFSILGVVEAVALSCGLITEVPSGVFADRFGKRFTLQISMMLCAVGGLIVAFSSHFLPLLIGFILVNIGWSLHSGCADAFAYDTLADHHKSDQFDAVVSKGYALATVTFATTSLIGGWMFLVHFRMPHIIWGLFYLIGFVALFFTSEPKSKRAENSIMPKSFAKLMKEGFSILLHTQVKKVLFLIVLLQSIYFIYAEGFLQPAMALEYELGSTAQSLVFAMIGLICAGVALMLPFLRRKLRDTTLFVMLCMLFGLVMLVGAFVSGFSGVAILFLLSVIGTLSLPLTAVFVSKYADEDSRATSLSVVAFVSKLPYAVLAIGMGILVEGYGVNILLILFGLICIVPSVVYALKFRRSFG